MTTTTTTFVVPPIELLRPNEDGFTYEDACTKVTAAVYEAELQAMLHVQKNLDATFGPPCYCHTNAPVKGIANDDYLGQCRAQMLLAIERSKEMRGVYEEYHDFRDLMAREIQHCDRARASFDHMKTTGGSPAPFPAADDPTKLIEPYVTRSAKTLAKRLQYRSADADDLEYTANSFEGSLQPRKRKRERTDSPPKRITAATTEE